MYKTLTATAIALFATELSPTAEAKKQPAKPNILFIAVDDLRPELNCYGQTHIVSPNIDKLAASGTMFTNAYCNVPVCGASRASILTGLRPGMGRFLTAASYAQEDAPDAIVLPQWFKNNGYITYNNGKVFHHPDDHAECWDENWRANLPLCISPESSEMYKKTKMFPITECFDTPDTSYADGLTAEKTIRDLQRLQKQNKPFFFAVGFLKPHLPFNAPKKYWDLYPANKVKLPDNNYVPKNCPSVAIHNNGELWQYSGIVKGPVSDSMATQLIRGYDACVSFSDAMVGKVLDELHRTGLDKNTIVVLWGDHGWNLREHTLWAKHCNFRTSLRSVLIVKVPGMPAKQVCDGMVEYVDIYPTLCKLAGIDLPTHLEGSDISPLLKNPKAPSKPFVISKYALGVTITTPLFSYTEWIDNKLGSTNRMLYNKTNDINENTNIAELPAEAATVTTLSETLRANWGKDFAKPANAKTSKGTKRKPNAND